jgi:hypothetical protein
MVSLTAAKMKETKRENRLFMPYFFINKKRFAGFLGLLRALVTLFLLPIIISIGVSVYVYVTSPTEIGSEIAVQRF